ncbi:23S rRNA (adenine(2503)-C(2))-methyltransferase RlmN [Butyrivibrio sp. MC2013]|uniref:23S rRNA (adenine(2503)-C(2))-methyltransferase RlmN n=1 Tax=Butyrivibrio sp. MC2013 TaxID=1280686 RepID=UPI0004120773|nr:23S rRNA (adenine(2503)-C(2))-methyltransferase RlmN [Butyrivibrio sp. MC2013]
MKRDLRSIPLDELINEIEGLEEKKFRARQLYEWIHKKMVMDYDEMKNIPSSLKNKLRENYSFGRIRAVEVRESAIDDTRKFLFGLEDGNVIESVYMKYKFGSSVCISSQVGCNMGCRFCASTIDGCIRSLSAGEMLGQIYAISRYMNERISHVVVMGSGEPLDNYDNLLNFIRMLTDENGVNLSQRNLTVSTCGLVPEMKKLADQKFQINLAISLHASNQAGRETLMPIARRYSLDELMEACRYYFDTTGRQLTFEYSLVKGVNDKEEDAAELAELLRDFNCVVNLIPVNPVKERDFKAPDKESSRAFQHRLQKKGINATIRREMGRDINGACGQLRRSYCLADNADKQ